MSREPHGGLGSCGIRTDPPPGEARRPEPAGRHWPENVRDERRLNQKVGGPTFGCGRIVRGFAGIDSAPLPLVAVSLSS